MANIRPAAAAVRHILLSVVITGACMPLEAFAISFKERDALWKVVEDLCLPLHQTLGLSLPCLDVDKKRGFAVIRAPGDETRIIIVPTAKIEGVESAALLRDDTPNFWSLAWGERNRVIASAPRSLAWNDIGMAINSSASRTQDQLHIHVDCVDPRLKRALAVQTNRLSKNWSNLNLQPWAGSYRVKRIAAEDLQRSVFQMVAREVPGARSRMGMQSIGVVGFVGGTGNLGFVVLVNGRGGHAEELLDHKCLSDRL